MGTDQHAGRGSAEQGPVVGSTDDATPTVQALVGQGYEIQAGQDRGEYKYMLLESARADAFVILRAPLGTSEWEGHVSGELRRANDKWAEVLDEAHLPRGRNTKRGDRRAS